VTRFRIEKLARHQAVDAFDCGQDALNRYLCRFALPNQQANAAQTYLGLADDEVAGFYTLAVGEVALEAAAPRLKQGLARHPVPVMLLARLAVDRRFQGQGVGAGLLKDAIVRTLRAADIAGIRALVVHAKDDSARAFYERFDFVSSPSDPLHLFALMKHLRSATSRAV
jgi:GNAT superfamily N-acetyltransferase